MDKLKYWLDLYIKNPKDTNYTFNLAREYDNLGQTASAAGFYLRSVEYGNNVQQNYEALLRMALCFEKQGNRVFTIKGQLLRAISYLPKRPEAYFLLARTYERNKDWQECYTISSLGYEFATEEVNDKIDVEYPGKIGLMFEKAVAAYWIGLFDQSLHILKDLKQNYKLPQLYADAVNNNLSLIGDNWKTPIEYLKEDWNRLRYKFKDSHTIERNHSQCFQDLFVLSMLDGKREGTYLEIGSAAPYYGNNTALLENQFGWKGVSIDVNQYCVDEFNKERNNKAICVDALKANYQSLLHTSIIDYLQIDCDPPTTSYEVLLKIPFHSYKFRVITFEHDDYVDETKSIKEKSRKYLKSLGYKLIVPDVAVDAYSSYEDWWVHPDLVNENIIELMVSNNEINPSEKYIFGEV